MGPADGDEPGGWCRVEPGGWVRRRRRAEPADRDRLVERVLALATKRSADARHARDALRAFRAALGTRDEANRARAASREPATALLAAARITKRLASRPEDLQAVERLLRAAASVTADDGKKPADDSESSLREASSRRAANVELGVLLCQEGRDAEAAQLLTAMGCRYRLARGVLRYPKQLNGLTHETKAKKAIANGVSRRAPTENFAQTFSAKKEKEDASARGNVIPVRAFDGALPLTLLARLRRVFAPDSAFWDEHGYHEEGCGFFSYAHDLTRFPERFYDHDGFRGPMRGVSESGGKPSSLMDVVIARVRAVVSRAFPAAAEATAAEWWAHSRPHASGHQMHFDSDDEGAPVASTQSNANRRTIRHPICSAVVFVTGGVGGPTLVTDQRDDAKRLARNGWLVAPVAGRVAVFDGECLHGVMPGRGLVSKRVSRDVFEPRRVTLMIAFWRDVEIRGALVSATSGSGTIARGSFPRGSARPFPDPRTFLEDDPTVPSKEITWPRAFDVDDAFLKETREETLRCAAAAGEVCAVKAAAVWEDVDAERNAACFPSLSVTELRSLPAYDACFMF
jgi:hypothetical protein